MSTNFLRIVPTDPGYVPAAPLRARAVALLRELVTAEEIRAIVHDEISFVDPGGNLEEVRCPSCTKSLDFEWWTRAVSLAHQKQFDELGIRVPCCGAETSLNDLDYRWPAGFARFVLEAREAPSLDADAVARLEALLGRPVRQILAHY